METPRKRFTLEELKRRHHPAVVVAAFGNDYRFLPLLAQGARGLAQSKTLRDFQLRASILDCASLLALWHGSQENSRRQTSIPEPSNSGSLSSIAHSRNHFWAQIPMSISVHRAEGNEEN